MPSTASVRRAAKVERETEKATTATAAEKKRADDAYWAAHGDGSKSKAAQRAEADAASADAKAAARAEARRQAQLEEEQFAGKKSSGAAVKKKTAYELAQGKEMDAKARLKAKFAAAKAAKNEVEEDDYADMVDRVNENRKTSVVSASGVDAAIEALSLEDSRSNSPAPMSMKAAYAQFEEEKLAELKADKPGLKMQQYRDLLSKLWTRDPRNPLNQRK